MTLKSSIYLLVAPVFLLFAILACGTALQSTPTYTCPTSVPEPAVTTLPGTPQPTTAPPATPYVITPPDDFFVGDAIYVGAMAAPLRVRFRLQQVMVHPAPVDGERVYAWQLEVKNVGSEPYEIFPAIQMYLSEIKTDSEVITGTWGSTRLAALFAGLPIDNDTYTLLPGEVQTFHFAAFGPAGEPERFTFVLDPTVTEGSGVITWINQTNPHCSGDIED